MAIETPAIMRGIKNLWPSYKAILVRLLTLMQYTHHTIEALLQPFKPLLGKDDGKYRNHVYRVFQHCLLLDANTANADKYAMAAVFHDIGIWTGHTIDYLAPSMAEAANHLNRAGQLEWAEEISLMIYWHHKTSPYQGPYPTTVETFRRADWMDVSLGLLTYGASRQAMRQYRRQWPNLGFHWFLCKKIFLNFLRHPWRPLPMFK